MARTIPYKLYRTLNNRIKDPLQLLAASQAANDSSFSTGRAWIWAVVTSIKDPQRGLRRQRAKTLLA